jgi:hypothetical protein
MTTYGISGDKRTIARMYKDKGSISDALNGAVDFCNHPTKEASINKYADGSMLYIDSTGTIRIVYRSTLPAWARGAI